MELISSYLEQMYGNQTWIASVLCLGQRIFRSKHSYISEMRP